MAKTTNGRHGGIEVLEPVGNGGAETIESGMPYVVKVKIMGTADILFHAWDCDSVEAKGNAAKGSKAKKSDDVESYVYRDEKGYICLPGEYLRQSVIMAAKFKQDPRSPRKSAMDLFKAGVVNLTALASLGSKDWDYLSKKRVGINRVAITRTRPAFRAGWTATIMLQVLLPEYINMGLLKMVLDDAGRLIGVGDFRPTYGRFSIVAYEVLPA